MSKFLDKILSSLANFSKDPSRMLIITGVIGWGFSAIAQMFGVIFNPKIDRKEKSYLLAQEGWDAIANIGCFFLITQLAKMGTAKLFKTGKLAPKSVREFISKNNAEIGEKIGKLDFNLGEYLSQKNASCFKDYERAMDFGTTAATIVGSVAATSVATPLIRNHKATKFQDKFIKYQETQLNSQPTFKSLHHYNYDMRI